MTDAAPALSYPFSHLPLPGQAIEIKPGVLKKAIKLAHKAEFGKAKQDHELLETILETVGKTL